MLAQDPTSPICPRGRRAVKSNMQTVIERYCDVARIAGANFACHHHTGSGA